MISPFREGQAVRSTFPRPESTEPVKVRRHGAVETEGKGEAQGAKIMIEHPRHR